MKSLKSLTFALIASLIGLGVGSAQAASIHVTLTGFSGSGPYTYQYTAVVTGGSQVQAGDYFTIYDFDGFVAGSNTQPADWSFSSPNTGVTPTTPIPFAPSDNPGIPNLVWTYTGVNPIPLTDLVNDTTLGLFSADSTNPNHPALGLAYAASDHEFNADMTTTHVSDNAGSVTGPTAVPVPASAWAGLVLLGALAVRRQVKALKA